MREEQDGDEYSHLIVETILISSEDVLSYAVKYNLQQN